MNTLSFFGESLGLLNIYKLFYNNDEFRKFMMNIHNDTFEDVCMEFINKFIHKYCDDVTERIINNMEFKTLFNNVEIDNNDKIQIFVGKILSSIYDKYTHMENNNRYLTMFGDFVTFNIEKSQLINMFIENYDTNSIDIEFTNSLELYNKLVNMYTVNIYNSIKELESFGDINNYDITEYLINSICKICEYINSVFSYDNNNDGDSNDSSEDNSNKRKINELENNEVIPNKKPRHK